ncbi:MAG: CPBP family intramembrane metalloprotease [Armatimonadetes bacterium]|nr:CPBP family intramembrane metalloprotease [Armatimonadota bacterium]
MSVVVSQALMTVTALLASWREGLDLFPAYRFEAWHLALAAAFIVPTLGTLPIRWEWRGREGKRSALWRLPKTSRDLTWWIWVAVIAGVCEEIVYRGVMFQLWERVFGGGWWPSALLCSAVFAVAHAIQGWRSVAIIFFLALANHAIVLWTGGLYTAMAIHVAYDFLAGVVFIALIRRDRLLEDGPTDMGPPEDHAGETG